jgi:hypothetical protein
MSRRTDYEIPTATDAKQWLVYAPLLRYSTLPVPLTKFPFLLQHTDIIIKGHEFSYPSNCNTLNEVKNY